MSYLIFLPEVCIEAADEADNDQGADDIPYTPAFANALLELRCEGDSIHLFLRRSRREATDNNHQDDNEYEEPALEDEPVGLPEP